MRIGLDARAAFLDPERGFGRVTRELADALLAVAPGQVVVFVPPRCTGPGSMVPAGGRGRPTEPAAPGGVCPTGRPGRGPCAATRWTCSTSRRGGSRRGSRSRWWPPSTTPRRSGAVAPPGVAAAPAAGRGPVAAPYRPRPCRLAILRARARPRSRRPVRAPGPRGALGRRGAVALPWRRSHGAPALRRRGQPHKNLALLLDMMVLPGAGGPAAAGGRRRRCRLRRACGGAAGASPLAGRVTVAGHLDDGALAELYRRALALLVPSLNEGFGLPVLEAMACGCPVLASRAGALPEVVGDAGLLLPPDDAAAWLREPLALAADGERRAVLSEDGRGRAARTRGPPAPPRCSGSTATQARCGGTAAPTEGGSCPRSGGLRRLVPPRATTKGRRSAGGPGNTNQREADGGTEDRLEEPGEHHHRVGGPGRPLGDRGLAANAPDPPPARDRQHKRYLGAATISKPQEVRTALRLRRE